MSKFPARLVIPTRPLFEGEIAYAEIPGVEGNFGIMAKHEIILATHRPGVITFWMDEEGKEKKRFAIYEGCTYMIDNYLSILARMGRLVDEIDAAYVKGARRRALDTIADLEADKDRDFAQNSALDIARARLSWYENQLRIVGEPLD